MASQLAFAHEVGHSLGADHDPLSEECSPGNSHDGNYLMFRKSNPGIYKNNRLFSKCSKKRMGKVMHTLVNNRNKFCFKSKTNSDNTREKKHVIIASKLYVNFFQSFRYNSYETHLKFIYHEISNM